MGLYSHCLFPFLCDHLQPPHLTELRAALLEEVSGRVLEIGFGTGLSLPHYGGGVRTLIGLDPERGMLSRANRRMREATIPVRRLRAVSERLPLEDASVDAVVSICTLCTVRDLNVALAEIARVLRPGGKFHFLEHGLAGQAALVRVQRLLEPLHKRLALGCHLTRDVLDSLDNSPLRVLTADRFTLRGAPAYLGQMASGVAEK